tara:strand:- start:245 stop:1690 length:1446 start_codon:yes stop_codon:yes gene_type:complete
MGNVNIISTLENRKRQKKSVFNTSSTVFFGIYNEEKQIDTEVSLLNHFIIKRNILDAVARVEFKDFNGNEVKSFKIKFNEERVYSIKISDYFEDSFIGSIFVFFESNENLGVPFCAVFCSIKSPKSVCGVHTYGRRLEKQEYGTGIELSETIETGWTVRDSKLIKSFSVLHGGEFKMNLKIRVDITNIKGEVFSFNKDFVLHPFGTLLIIPQDLSIGLIEHLDGDKGHAKVYIKGLKGIFPRMMCGNSHFKENTNIKLLNAEEIQFTHTNFDFSSIIQPDAGGSFGYYNQPSLPDGYGIAYPVETQKKIYIGDNQYISNSLHEFQIKPMSQIPIKCENENLPSRFVTAAVGVWKNSNLESECSTGTFIEDYIKVPCHWHWGLLKPGIEDGKGEISIIFNKFKNNKISSRKLKIRIFNEQKLLKEKDFTIDGSSLIKTEDLLTQHISNSSMWYVLSGDKLEDLNIFSTFYPENKSGFTEHAF